ncbi:MAG TPA: hydrogen peroxide-dependent heme synthase [Actinomycetota bacterium]|nr:hydrogen peroxide-dependent heme synthase [Actinomycetota bacterium]
MTEATVFSSFPVYKLARDRAEDVDPELAAKQLTALFDDWSDRVQLRGAYDTQGFSARADLMFWLVSSSADDIQELVTEMRRTELGRSFQMADVFLGIVRPAEFARDHQPAFVQNKEPLKYLCIYPFVRTAEWYLLDPEERGALLREHGTAGREFPDVQANTTSSFGLGDYEWTLAFEAESLDRIVDLIRRLRGTEARRFTKVEIPFFTGIRKDIPTLVSALL